MCLGVYGRVLSLRDDAAMVDLGGGVVKEVMIGVEELEPGDYVVVHAGIIVSKLSRGEFLHVLANIKESAESLQAFGGIPRESLDEILRRVEYLSSLLETHQPAKT
jgi:hydrogenase expression/formation protein HypC